MQAYTFIEFPKMGIQFALNRVAFTLLGKDIYWYGIIIAIGLILGLVYAVCAAKKNNVSQDIIYDLVLWGLPAAIVFARLYYVAFDPASIEGQLWKIVAVWEGGLAIYGAIIGASIAGVIYCRVKRLNLGLIFDICAPGLMIGQIIGRLGNFVNGEVYGVLTDLPWGMSVGRSNPVHPLFAYEMLWMTIGLIALLLYVSHKRRTGEIFWLYVLWYGLGRVWLEGLRDNNYIMRLGIIPISQLIAAAAIIVAVCALLYLYKKHKN